MKIMENNINNGIEERGAQEKMDEIQNSIIKFYEDNPNILKAISLFRMTNGEYERAIASLYDPQIVVSNSTSGGDY